MPDVAILVEFLISGLSWRSSRRRSNTSAEARAPGITKACGAREGVRQRRRAPVYREISECRFRGSAPLKAKFDAKAARSLDSLVRALAGMDRSLCRVLQMEPRRRLADLHRSGFARERGPECPFRESKFRRAQGARLQRDRHRPRADHAPQALRSKTGLRPGLLPRNRGLSELRPLRSRSDLREHSRLLHRRAPGEIRGSLYARGPPLRSSCRAAQQRVQPAGLPAYPKLEEEDRRIRPISASTSTGSATSSSAPRSGAA